MKNTVTHEDIKKMVHKIVNENFVDYEHARESLDDIIDDLHRYRSSIMTVAEYEEAGLL
jgi:thiamine phosphate synthase YjbQ (UPF0047 family)